MSIEISFDKSLAVASIPLAQWPLPLVEHLRRHFDIQDDVLKLDYSHLSADGFSVFPQSCPHVQNDRERLVFEFAAAAEQGSIELTLALLGHEFSALAESSTILDREAYQSAEQALRDEMLGSCNVALRDAMKAQVAPRAKWVRWLLEPHWIGRHRFLADEEIMAVLVAGISESDCLRFLGLLKPQYSEDARAFEQLVQKFWPRVHEYLEGNVGKAQVSSSEVEPGLLSSLFSKSPTVQRSRQSCELVLNQASLPVLSRLLPHCHAIAADDVRSLLKRWDAMGRPDAKSAFTGGVAAAFSNLVSSSVDALPSDLALAGVWHGFIEKLTSSGQESVAASLRELPSNHWDHQTLWSRLGPSAREAWRQDLLDKVTGEPELGQGLISFACMWLEQVAFAEVEPVLLRLMGDELHMALVTQLTTASTRQVQLRAKGLIRSSQGALDLEGSYGQIEDATAFPSVGAKTWLGDPSVERVIHRVLSLMEGEFCRGYSASWGEDEEAHTARLLALTEAAANEANRQLHQLSATTRGKHPRLSVSHRQPTKREEGASTPVGAPLGADVLFLTRIVDQGTTVVQRATMVQVKKRRGTASGKSFSSTIDVDLQQCEDLLTQSEHAYYLFMTPAAPRPVLWVTPARLVRNLTQLHTSKASVVAMQVRDASASYADFFLHQLIGLWAGDEREDIVAIANGDSRRGRLPRHIITIEIRRQSD